MIRRPLGTRAFTLIETLVVVIIVGILAAIALPKYERSVERSYVTEAKITLNALVKNREMCEWDFDDTDNSPCYNNADDDDDNFSQHLVFDFPVTTNCVEEAPCISTEHWEYDLLPGANSLSAMRITKDKKSLYYVKLKSDGVSFYCDNNVVHETDKDYCKMLCGGDGCSL